jgi:hypothetical protein
MSSKYPRFALSLSLVAVVAAGFLLLNENGKPSPEQASSSAAAAHSERSSPESLGVVVEIPASSPGGLDPWTARLIESRVAVTSRIDAAAIQAFNQWANDFAAGESSAGHETLALALAPIRRAGLKELIKQDPEAAWAAMLPAGVRASLPEGLQPFLEESISGTADWEVYAACFWNMEEVGSGCPHCDDCNHHHHPAIEGPPPSVIQMAILAGQTYNAFAVGALRDSATQRAVAVEGYAIDGTAVFHSLSLTSGDDTVQFLESPSRDESDEGVVGTLAPAFSVPGQPDSLPLSGRQNGNLRGGLTTDYRTLLYMRIAFADNPTAVVQTEQNAYNDLITVNDTLLEASFGRMQILPTVTPIIVLPEVQSFYASAGTSRLAQDARAVAASMGYLPDQYGHRVYRYNGAPGNFGGFATIGGNPGDIWVRFNSASLLTHELGHNYTLFHSNGWNTERRAAIGPSASTEYDHNFCIMSDNYDFSLAGFNSFQKFRAGWLRPFEFVDSLVSGRHRIHAVDHSNVDPDKQYAIRIRTPNRDFYWLEYRKNYTNTAFRNGLLLQSQGAAWGGTVANPQRIDVTYWSKNDDRDSTIPIGWTFSDHEQGVHITPLLRAGDFSWIDVQVNHIESFVNNSPPTANFTVSNPNPAVGETVTFTLTDIADPDGDELRYFWYFDNDNYHNFSASNFTSRTRSWDTPGVYNVIAVVTDMKGGTSFQSIPVTVGTPSNFSISGVVLDHQGNGIAGVAIDNGLAFNNNNFRSTLTNEAGEYTLGRLPAGSYTIRAAKDFDNYARRGTPNPITVGPSATDINFRARVLKVEAVGPAIKGGTPGQFIISRVQGTTGERFTGDISFRTSLSGDAVEGVDYTISPAPVGGLYSITGGADNESLTLTVTAINNGLVEGPKDVTLSLAMSQGLALVDTQTTKATLLIKDAGSTDARVRAIPMSRHIDENGGTADVLFIRYGDTSNDLTVNLATSTGAGVATYGQDYIFNTGSLSMVIPAGADRAVLQVIAVNNNEVQDRKRIRFRLIPGTGYIADRNPVHVEMDIVDDDLPTVTVTAVDGLAGEANNDLGVIRFTRNPVSSLPLVINYGVSGNALHGTDYAQLSGVATIPANAASVDVVIEGLADALIEGTETAVVRASSSNNFDYLLNDSAYDAIVSIYDLPILNLIGPSEPFSRFSPEPRTYTINRVGPTGPITVTIQSIGTAEGGVDFSFPSTVQLAANQSSTTFQVTPISDSTPKEDETVILTIVPQLTYGIGNSPSASQVIEDLRIDEWRLAFFGSDATNPAIAGDFADPDGDGIPNLLEYAIMGNPLVPNSVNLTSNVNGNSFRLEYKRRKNAGVTIQCLWTQTLDQPDSWTSVGVTEEIIGETSEYFLIRASIPISAQAGFLRIEVTRE